MALQLAGLRGKGTLSTSQGSHFPFSEHSCIPEGRAALFAPTKGLADSAVPIGRAPLAWNPLMLPTPRNWESPLLQRLVKKHFKEMLESHWTHFSARQISVYYNFSPLLNFKVILQEMKMVSNLL